jgi:hypothetical protein
MTMQQKPNNHPVIVEMDDVAIGVLVPVDGRFEFVANDPGPITLNAQRYRSVAEALHEIRRDHDRRKNNKGAA